MNLSLVTPANEHETREAFALAIRQARLIYETCPASAEFPRISAADMAARNSAMDYLSYMVARIGTTEFVRPDMVALIKGLPIAPLQDWPLFIIADVLVRCDAAAKPQSDRPTQPPLIRGTAFLNSLMRLCYVSDATEIEVNRTRPHPWSTQVQEQVRLRLLNIGALGEWTVDFHESDATFVAYPRYAVEQTLLTVRLPAWFDFAIVDGTVVLASEAEQVRLERLRMITTDLSALNEKTVALLERQRKILVPPNG